MNDTYITIVGNAVDAPRMRMTKSQIPVTTLRIGSTSRRIDRETGQWTDHEKLFVTITCWRSLAENVATSIKKGQPVLVTGRFYSRQYQKDETVRVSYELDAIAVGHDLARGQADFTKVNRNYATTTVEVADDGMPADMTDLRIEAEQNELAAVG